MGRRGGALTLSVVLMLASCGGTEEPRTASPSSPSSSPSSSPPTPTPSESPSASASASSRSKAPEGSAGRVITTGASAFGPMLFDGRGQAIYLFEPERTPEPRCYDACAEAWPPVLTRSAPQAKGDARPALLGTTRRRDGSRQVTYGGHPLYYYAHEGVGEVLCHDVVLNGGLWLVVTPGGGPAPH
jgi:predicted lipoprotein with Yx(FWY)xxD motif